MFLMGSLSDHNKYSSGKFNWLKCSPLLKMEHEPRSFFDTCLVLLLLTFAVYVNKCGKILKVLYCGIFPIVNSSRHVSS